MMLASGLARLLRPAPRRPATWVVWTVLLTACDRGGAERSGGEEPVSGGPLIQLSRGESARPTGSIFDDRDFRLEVGTPSICNETAPFLPEPGLMRLSIPVEVRAKTPRLIPISPLSFQLTDRQDRRYGPTLAGCRPALRNIRLGEGQSVKGDVAFDVAVDARDLELAFDPFLIGRSEVHALVRVPSPPVRSAPTGPAPTEPAPSASAAAPPPQ